MKKLLCLFLSAVLLFSALPTVVTAEPAPPSVSIDYYNLSFEDNVYIKYAVALENVGTSTPDADDLTMYYWTSEQTEYLPATASSFSHCIGTQEIASETYYIFKYTELTAKQMTDVIYCKASVKVGGTEYFSTVTSYSVCEYVDKMLGLSGSEPTENADLISLLLSMVEYGANAQKYFNYKKDHLATDILNLTVTFDSNGGSAVAPVKVHYGNTISAPAVPSNAGQIFLGWYDGKTLFNFSSPVKKNMILKAKWAENTTGASVGLRFADNGDGTCHVRGIGTCTDTDVVIPIASPEGKGVTGIGTWAFYECTDLTSVTIPDSVAFIDDAAFKGCTGLTSVTIPNSVESIGNSAFKGCMSLTSITIPDSVESIDFYAFQDCETLTSATIGDGVKAIKSAAFSGCFSLISVTLGSRVENIGENAFYSCPKLIEVCNRSGLSVVAGSSQNGGVGSYAEHIITDPADSYLKTDGDGFVFYDDGTKLQLMGYRGSSAAITLPEKFEDRNYTLWNVHSSGILAYNRTITSVVIPNTIDSVPSGMFTGCANLTSVTIADSVKSIGDYAFYGCTKLTSVTIGNGVKSIGWYAFYECTGLTNVTIPDSVKSISSSAFAGCTGLTSVTFVGTVAQWNAVTKGSDWKLNAPFTQVICSDGTVNV